MSGIGAQRTVYRSPGMAGMAAIGGVVVGLQMIAILVLTRPHGVDGVEVWVGLALSLWAIFRLRRCGLYADDDGVRVLNPVSSTRLRWDEIRRFVLMERGACGVERVDGATVKVFGLQQTTWAVMRGSLHTRETVMIDELNRRLDERAPSRG